MVPLQWGVATENLQGVVHLPLWLLEALLGTQEVKSPWSEFPVGTKQNKSIASTMKFEEIVQNMETQYQAHDERKLNGHGVWSVTTLFNVSNGQITGKYYVFLDASILEMHLQKSRGQTKRHHSQNGDSFYWDATDVSNLVANIWGNASSGSSSEASQSRPLIPLIPPMACQTPTNTQSPSSEATGKHQPWKILLGSHLSVPLWFTVNSYKGMVWGQKSG